MDCDEKGNQGDERKREKESVRRHDVGEREPKENGAAREEREIDEHIENYAAYPSPGLTAHETGCVHSSPHGPGDFLELLAGPEDDDPVILSLENVACFGIPHLFSRPAQPDLERAEPPKLDYLVLANSPEDLLPRNVFHPFVDFVGYIEFLQFPV